MANIPHIKSLAYGTTVTNSTTSWADVTGLSCGVDALTAYYFFAIVPYTVNATTTGTAWSINGPSSPTLFWCRAEWAPLSSATGAWSTEHTVAYDTVTASTDTYATTGAFARLTGVIQVGSTAGQLTVRNKSEVAVAGAVVVQGGARFEVRPC